MRVRTKEKRCSYNNNYSVFELKYHFVKGESRGAQSYLVKTGNNFNSDTMIQITRVFQNGY